MDSERTALSDDTVEQLRGLAGDLVVPLEQDVELINDEDDTCRERPVRAL